LLNKKKVQEKYGPNLRIHESGRLVTELYYPKSLKTELKYFERADVGQINNIKSFSFSYYGNESKEKRKDTQCALCGSTEELELHRINPPKKINRKTPVGDYNRNTVTLCRSCHRSSHGIHGKKNKYKEVNLGKLKSEQE
jgi:5-methylcytosine-specific restriction endonuclease McrA